MKKIKIFAMLFAMIFLSACSKTDKTKSLTLNVDTGDSVKVGINMKQGNDISFDKEKNIINISDKDGKVPAQGIFVPQKSYSLYYETAYTDDRCSIKDSGRRNGIAYTYYTYNNNGEINCEFIGWIIGSNTGIVFESTTLSEEDGQELFRLLQFSTDKTEQVNAEYAYEPNIDKEPSETRKPDVTASLEVPKETPDNTGNSDTSSKGWTSMEIKIDGVSYSFPYSYSMLQKNGWGFDINEYLNEGETEYILAPGEYTYSTTKLDNEKYGKDIGSAAVYAGFKNFDEKAKNITDCNIWALEVSGVYGTAPVKNCPDVELPGGIKFGASKEDITKLYGEPSEVYDNGYYIQMDYENDYSQHMTLYVYTGADGSTAKGLLDAEFKCYQ